MFKITDGQLTIKNGSINTSGEAFRLDATAGGNPELVLDEDVKVVSKNDCCIFIKGKAKVTSSATLTSTGIYAPIQGNGSLQSAGSEIDIIGGSIISEDVAIYQPQNGILNISNCNITGTSALYIKSGTVNIGEGAVITGHGNATAYVVNNNGCNATGDAIVVDFCGYPGGDPSLNITGGVISSVNAKAIEAYDKEGNVAPAIAETNINISGGRFGTSFDSSYLADGYVLKTGTGVCEVAKAV